MRNILAIAGLIALCSTSAIAEDANVKVIYLKPKLSAEPTSKTIAAPKPVSADQSNFDDYGDLAGELDFNEYMQKKYPRHSMRAEVESVESKELSSQPVEPTEQDSDDASVKPKVINVESELKNRKSEVKLIRGNTEPEEETVVETNPETFTDKTTEQPKPQLTLENSPAEAPQPEPVKRPEIDLTPNKSYFEAEKHIPRSQFTSNVEKLEPSDNLESIERGLKTLFYFTEIRDMGGKAITHRWEAGGKIITDKRMSISGSKWRAWSSIQIKPEYAPEISVSVIDSNGAIMKKESIEFSN